MHKKLWNRDYILLLQGSAVSTVGDLMYSVAIGYWVYEKTGSSGLMGIMASISMFVTMFLSPFTGSIVDKCNRKWVLVGMDFMQGILMLTIGALAYLDSLSVPIVLIAAFLASLGGVFYSPAANTLMIDIIPHQDMVRGQSIFSGMRALIDTVGSAFSGMMVAFFGVSLIIVINGISNLYAAVSELFVHVPRTLQQGTPVSVSGILRDSRDAVKTIFSDRFLRLFIPSALILNLLGAGPLTLMLPFCLEKGFSVDMYGYGMTVYTAASLICVLILGIVKLSPKARFLVMAAGFSSGPIVCTLAYLSTRFVPICGWFFLAAFLNTAANTVFNAALMLALPEENRGAILGFFQAACTGGTALSAVIYGLLGDVFPLHLVFVVGSLLSLGPMLNMCLHRSTKEFMLTH